MGGAERADVERADGLADDEPTDDERADDEHTDDERSEEHADDGLEARVALAALASLRASLARCGRGRVGGHRWAWAWGWG